MKLVLLPYPTYHSVRGNIVKVLGQDIRLRTVLEDDFIDLADELHLRLSIKKGLKKIFGEIDGLPVEIYMVLIGHPYISLLIYCMLEQEYTEDVKLLIWDSYRKRYLVKTLPKQAEVRVLGR